MSRMTDSFELTDVLIDLVRALTQLVQVATLTLKRESNSSENSNE